MKQTKNHGQCLLRNMAKRNVDTTLVSAGYETGRNVMKQ